MRDACHFVAGVFAALLVQLAINGGTTSMAAFYTTGLIVALAIPRTK